MQYNKATFKQWWEFLKLSENYRSICELASKHKKNADEFPLKRLLDELEKNENFKPIEKYMKLLAVYEKFGDVHQDDFEDWWKNYKQPKSVKTEKKLKEYKKEKYRRINEALEAHDKLRQLYEEIRWKIIYYPDTYDTHPLHVNIHSPIKNIKSHIGSVVKELKKQAKTNQREVINERDEYLCILRLFLQDDSMPQIIKKIGSKKEKQFVKRMRSNKATETPDPDILRSYRDKKHKAELILRHVEEGRFP